ncbi:hypothetical protein ABH15_04740 [Methanoculleus taiwanensis]|uniref:Uncharacterized protein n=1 Tax=Methanoculleus taiwanensis TaxID=1550565 RepID=A0A498H779_9EURY|nr:hypothetical protein [Methanoculleus taiwanensis]RXE57394.1 hypothetical protein ABH15_04740 [Methanoculleus taiwanensis]
MAQKDARIRFLERELAEREGEMEKLKGVETVEFSDNDDERLRGVERKIKEIEALMKGLTEEMLDLKSIVMKMQRQTEERMKMPVAAVPAAVEPEPRKAVRPAEPEQTVPTQNVRRVSRTDPLVRPTAVPRQSLVTPQARPAPRAAPVPEPEDTTDMELIMQNDGTLKPEKRTGSEYIVASNKYQNKVMGGKRKGSSDRIVVAEPGQRTKEVDSIIHADEDDTIEFDSNK